ncbi:MAG: hypothetical protein Q7U70_03490 [Methylotenera sp.]|nr:hypothetical protein [Methylotenera sp.]
MSFCLLYIGQLDDPSFDYDDWSNVGNIPIRRSPHFPPTNPSPYNRFYKWVEKSGCKSNRVDWGATVAIVNKAQIEDLITQCYSDDLSYSDPEKMSTWEGKPYLVNQLLELRVFVANLDAKELYALVACET